MLQTIKSEELVADLLECRLIVDLKVHAHAHAYMRMHMLHATCYMHMHMHMHMHACVYGGGSRAAGISREQQVAGQLAVVTVEVAVVEQ